MKKKFYNYYVKRQYSSHLKDMIWKYHEKPIDSAYTPPNSWYIESQFYDEVELKHIFPKSWLLVGKKSDLANVGDYIAGNISKSPWVVINTGKGLKSFHNVCRHHAAQILDDGIGSINNPMKRLKCPYHGWQYTIDGKLAQANQMKGCSDFKASDNGLLPMLVDEIGPWIFLRADTTDSSGSLLTDQPDMKNFFDMLEKTDYENLVHVESRSYHIQCNYKVFIDNYLDGGYHVPYAHPRLSESLDMKTYTRISYDNFFLQSCGGRTKTFSVADDINSSSKVKERVSESPDEQALYLFHYPNLCINRYGSWLDTNIVLPTGVNSCTVKFDWYVSKDKAKDREYIDACLKESEEVQKEDMWLCERVQKGLQSPAYSKGGRYAPLVEQGEYMYHQKLNQDFLKVLSQSL